MTNYDGNGRGFIYVACEPEGRSEVVKRFLDPVESRDRPLCLGFWTGALRSQIARAHALMVFLTQAFADDSRFGEMIELAVRHNKPMLIVYLEDVELTPVLTMQTDAQQSLFVKRFDNDEDIVEELKKAAVFDNIQVSPEQKKQQRRRMLVPLAAAAVVVAAAVMLKILPTLGIGQDYDDTAGAFGIPGVSMYDIRMINNLNVVGREVFDDRVGCGYSWDPEREEIDTSRIGYEYDTEEGEHIEGETTRGDISDLSGIEQFVALHGLQLAGQKIEDISPLVELYEQRTKRQDVVGIESEKAEKSFWLSLACNPISSIDGLEKFESLGDLDISSTNVSKLPEGLDVRCLNISDTDISELPEGLALQELCANDTKLTAVPDFSGKSDAGLEAWNTELKDVSNLASAESYMHLGLDADGKEEEIIGLLKGIPIKMFECNGMQIDSLEELSELDVSGSLNLMGSSLTSLKGIEHFEGIEELYLGGCECLTDLSDVNKLKSLKSIHLWQEQAYLAGDVDDRIEVIIE